MSLSRILKDKRVLLLVAAVLIIAVASGGLTGLSIYSYAKEVPVQVGVDPAQKCWVLGAVLNERVSFKMVLHDKTSEKEGLLEYTTLSEVAVVFDPEWAPDSKTDLLVTNLQFKNAAPESYTAAPVWLINTASWLTTAYYSVTVFKNGQQVGTPKIVSVNYQTEHVVHVETPEGTVTINNLGLLMQGVEAPGGSLAVLSDPYGGKHIVDKDDVTSLIDKWNVYAQSPGAIFTQPHDWTDVYNYGKQYGYWPQDIPLTHVSQVTYSSDMSKITLYYGSLVFAASLSVFVPSNLADEIIVKLDNPYPQIVAVDPAAATVIEGQKKTLSVTVKNAGTSGYISISVVSDNFAVSPLTTTTRFFQEEEQFVFQFELFCLNVNADLTSTIIITAQGRGGTANKRLYWTVKNDPNVGPVDPDIDTLLKVMVVNWKYEPVRDVVVNVEAGTAGHSKITGDSGVVEFGLGQYTGAVKVTVMDQVATFPVKKGINEYTVVLGAQSDWGMYLVLALIAVVGVVLVVKWRRKIG